MILPLKGWVITRYKEAGQPFLRFHFFVACKFQLTRTCEGHYYEIHKTKYLGRFISISYTVSRLLACLFIDISSDEKGDFKWEKQLAGT